MPNIRFITDYRGVLSGEVYYQVGDIADLHRGAQLVADGRAVRVEPDALPPEDDPELDSLSLSALRKLAKADGVKGWSRMNRETLIDLAL